MKLLCYSLNKFRTETRRGEPTAPMDGRFPDRHAYRCLPFSIANAHG